MSDSQTGLCDVTANPISSFVAVVDATLVPESAAASRCRANAVDRAWGELSATWQQYASRIALDHAGVEAVRAWLTDPDANYAVLSGT